MRGSVGGRPPSSADLVFLKHKATGAVARLALVGVPAAFLGLFFVYPLATIFRRGLGGSLPTDVLFDRGTLRIVWFTVWQATASTALTLAVGMPLAWATARVAFRGRGLVRALVVVPFVLPTVVVATAFLALLPESMQRGIVPILLAHVFFNVAVVVRVVGGYWARLDPTLWDAAATLGASPARRFRELTLPALRPALAAASALTFLFCFTSFGVIVILGGPRFATLEVDIYDLATQAFDLRAAAALSLLQLVAVAAIVAMSSTLEARAGARVPLAVEQIAARRPRGWERPALGAILAVAALGFGLPLAALVERSFATPNGAGLAFYRALGRETPTLLVAPWRAVEYSLAYAAAATAIALTVGALAAAALAHRRSKRWLDTAVMLPLGASAVMLGYGFVIAFDTPPLDFRDSAWIVPVVQALVAAPFVVRIVAPALRGVDPRLREAAAVLGAPPARVRREIDLPLVLRPLGVAAGLAFAIALGEFGATVFLARSDRPTLPVAIFRFLERPGATNQGTAAALCVVLMTVTVVAVGVANRLTSRRGAV
jgi:thiamine transport system permease protein